MNEAVEQHALALRTSEIALRNRAGLMTFEDIFDPPKAETAETVASILAEYRAERGIVEAVAAFFSNEGTRGAMEHFLDAAKDRHSGHTPNVDRLFDLDPAVKVLDATYWQRVLATTDVYAAMPQKRRDEWNESIRKRTTVPFDETTVLLTLQRLLADRKTYFAEKVDGVFRNLSGEHVTNSPLGFGQRMILQGVYDGYHSTHRCGYVSDLREVIARFMGRAVPDWLDTWGVVKYAREYHCGQWVPIDGGAIRIRVYQNGNGHLHIHPDMAWRLNCVLHSLYPNAIASEHRQRPKKQPKDWPLFGRPLPWAVLALLREGGIEAPVDEDKANALLRQGRWVDEEDITPQRIAARVHEGWRFTFHYSKNAAKPEARRVLESLGATRVDDERYDFPYNPREVLLEVVASGCLPDRVAHQYYPTPTSLAQRAVDLAEIGPDHSVLEPSAGQGAIADLLPRACTVCVEVSRLHYLVLEAKGHDVVRTDFLSWKGGPFDRIVMNPPFSEGRWLAHVEHAADLLTNDGRLVAILPASARNRKGLLPGWDLTWSEDIANEFEGTSTVVVILVAERK